MGKRSKAQNERYISALIAVLTDGRQSFAIKKPPAQHPAFQPAGHRFSDIQFMTSIGWRL